MSTQAPDRGRRRRAAIALVAVTAALLLANFLFTAHYVNQATATRASVVQLCQLGNESRAEQVGLWDYIIRLSGPPPTAAARARLAKFEAHLHQVFAPRNCTRRFS